MPAKLKTPFEVALDNAFADASLKVRYEPKVFRSRGTHKVGFRPDFYLPEVDLYVEVGIYERKKSKARMMRQHHPDVRLLIIDNTEVAIYCQTAPELLKELLDKAGNTNLVGLSQKKRFRTVYDLFKELTNQELSA